MWQEVVLEINDYNFFSLIEFTNYKLTVCVYVYSEYCEELIVSCSLAGGQGSTVQAISGSPSRLKRSRDFF